MDTESHDLSPSQEKAAVLLAGGATIRKAAEVAEVSRRTIFRWLDDPAFKGAVNRLRGAVIDRSVARLVAASTKAVATLSKLMDSPTETIKLAAARAILDALIKTREHAELDARIRQIEENAQ